MNTISFETEVQRNTWTFLVPLATLQEAAQRKLAHHRNRLIHWEEKYELAKTKLKDEGIVFQDELDDDQSFENSYMHETVRVEVSLERPRQDALRKVKEHKQAIADVARWHRAFIIAENTKVTKLPCTILDLAYFYL